MKTKQKSIFLAEVPVFHYLSSPLANYQHSSQACQLFKPDSVTALMNFIPESLRCSTLHHALLLIMPHWTLCEKENRFPAAFHILLIHIPQARLPFKVSVTFQLLNSEPPISDVRLSVTTEANQLTTNPSHIFQVSNWRRLCVFP